MPRKLPTFKRVAPGIHRHRDSGHFYERIRLNGRRTWRRLHSSSLSDAVAESAAKRTDHHRAKLGLAVDPYAPKVKPLTVGEVLEHYRTKGFPNQRGRQRSERTRLDEERRLPRLLSWWGSMPVADVSYRKCAEYGRSRVKQDGRSGRATDLDLWTLANAFKCALRGGLVDSNPLSGDRPAFGDVTPVRQSRETMPESVDELHLLAARLFDNPRSEVIGFQLLIEALSGLRTSEALALRIDAQNSRCPGFIEGDWLWVKRLKRGVNPFALIHPDLRELMQAHRNWLRQAFPGSPWWFPTHRHDGKVAVNAGALSHALRRLTKELSLPPRTSHGLRAYYVTTRRAQGIPDAQVAAEIGDASGAEIITNTYGAVPPNWRGQGMQLGWRPASASPAWSRWL